MSEPVRIIAADGYSLGGQVFATEAPPKAVVVIAPAMAVLQRIYRAFASDLSKQGIATVTFDYRGLGESAPESLRGFEATATDWARLDLTAVIDFARERFAGRPTFVVGHSIGGQILGLCPRADTLAGAVLVAAQSGYWKHWSGVGRALLLAHWHVMPLVARAMGYLPMAAVRQGEDVPLGAALEWARWGRRPEYVMSSPDAAHGSLTLPMRIYGIADDSYAPLPAVRALAGFYSGASPEVIELHPNQLGTRSIGHFGIFRREFRATFYAEIARWVLERAAGKVAA